MNILQDALFFLGTLSFCGSILTWAITQRFENHYLHFLVFWALAWLLSRLLRKSAPARRLCVRPQGRLAFTAPLLSLVLAVLLAWGLGSAEVNTSRVISGPLSLYASYDTAGHNACHLRGVLPRSKNERQSETVLSVIGDSFIYGTGVEAAEALPAVLTQTLSQANARSVVAANAGVPGASILSYARMIEYARTCIAPNAYLVFLSDSDAEEEDIHDRLKAVIESPWQRIAVGFNAETIVHEYARRLNRQAVSGPGSGSAAVVERGLGALARAAKNDKLLIVSNLPEKYRPQLVAFSAAHPEIGLLDLSADEEFQHAERCRDGVHWSPSGTKRVAALLTQPASWLLAPAGTPPKALVEGDDRPALDADASPQKVMELALKSLPPAFRAQVEPVPQSNVFIWNPPKTGHEIHFSAFFCGKSKNFFMSYKEFCFALQGEVLDIPEGELRERLKAAFETP